MFKACCGGCQFESDDFNRADSGSLGAKWTQDVGTWSITSNKLSTTSAPAAVKCTTANPAGDAFVRVQVNISGSVSNDKLRVVLDRQDASNYKYADFEFGLVPSIVIGHRSAGTDHTDTTVSSGVTLTAGTTYTVQVCFNSIFVLTAIINGGASASHTYGSSGGNPYVGLGTVSLGGTATFDNFSATKMSDSCPTCCAPMCSTACAFTAVSGSWTNSSGTITTASTSGIYLCNSTPTTGVSVSVDATPGSSGDNLRVIVGYHDYGGGSIAYWYVEITATTITINYKSQHGAITVLETSNMSFAAGTAYTIGVCLSANGFWVQVKVNGSIVPDMHFVATNAVAGSSFGLATGAAIGSTATFTNFSATNVGLACPDCGTGTDCTTCVSVGNQGFPPKTASGTVSGVTSSSCTDCAANANGSFVFNINPLPYTTYGAEFVGYKPAKVCSIGCTLSSSRWCSDPAAGVLASSGYSIDFAWFPQLNRTAVTLRFGGVVFVAGTTDIIVWQQGFDGQIDCNSFVGVTLPFLQNVGGYCDGSGSTATVSLT